MTISKLQRELNKIKEENAIIRQKYTGSLSTIEQLRQTRNQLVVANETMHRKKEQLLSERNNLKERHENSVVVPIGCTRKYSCCSDLIESESDNASSTSEASSDDLENFAAQFLFEVIQSVLDSFSFHGGATRQESLEFFVKTLFNTELQRLDRFKKLKVSVSVQVPKCRSIFSLKNKHYFYGSCS